MHRFQCLNTAEIDMWSVRNLFFFCISERFELKIWMLYPELFYSGLFFIIVKRIIKSNLLITICNGVVDSVVVCK